MFRFCIAFNFSLLFFVFHFKSLVVIRFYVYPNTFFFCTLFKTAFEEETKTADEGRSVEDLTNFNNQLVSRVSHFEVFFFFFGYFLHLILKWIFL